MPTHKDAGVSVRTWRRWRRRWETPEWEAFYAEWKRLHAVQFGQPKARSARA